MESVKKFVVGNQRLLALAMAFAAFGGTAYADPPPAPSAGDVFNGLSGQAGGYITSALGLFALIVGVKWGMSVVKGLVSKAK